MLQLKFLCVPDSAVPDSAVWDSETDSAGSDPFL